MSEPIRFYADQHSRSVRVHFPGETRDRWMDALAARVVSNQYKSVWSGKAPRSPRRDLSARARSLPAPIELPSRHRKYHFEVLPVGGSFLVPCQPGQLVKLMNSLSSCRNWQQRKSRRIGRPKRFALRKTICGVRVWRTA